METENCELKDCGFGRLVDVEVPGESLLLQYGVLGDLARQSYPVEVRPGDGYVLIPVDHWEWFRDGSSFISPPLPFAKVADLPGYSREWRVESVGVGWRVPGVATVSLWGFHVPEPSVVASVLMAGLLLLGFLRKR